MNGVVERDQLGQDWEQDSDQDTEQALPVSCVINYTNGDLTFSNLGFTPLGYNPPASVTWGEWMEAGRMIRVFDRFKNFAIGDWLTQGERKYGETYAAALDEFQWGDMNKLKKLAWVARSVPMENRHPLLTWTHHHNVAALPVEDQRDWLEYAALNELTAHELRQRIKEAMPALDTDAGTVTVDAVPDAGMPVDMDDLDGLFDGGAGAPQGIPDTTSPNAGWDTQPGADDDYGVEMEYDEDEDGKPGLRVQVPDDPTRAAAILFNTFGKDWCLRLVEKIGTSIADEYLD